MSDPSLPEDQPRHIAEKPILSLYMLLSIFLLHNTDTVSSQTILIFGYFTRLVM